MAAMHDDAPTHISHLPEGARPPTYVDTGLIADDVANNDGKNEKEGVISPDVAEYGPPARDSEDARKSTTVCGIRKKIFWIAIVLMLVIVAAVAGGVGGSLAAKKSAKSCADDLSACTTIYGLPGASPTSTSLLPTATPGPSHKRSIAAASYQDKDAKVYIYVFYQEGTEILYRIFPGSGTYSTGSKLAIGIVPKANSPIAATVYQEANGNTQVQIYYLDNSNNIIASWNACNPNSTTLRQSQNLLIASHTTTDIQSESSLAAIYRNSSAVRIYFQNRLGRIQELISEKNWEINGAFKEPTAINGSAIAATSDLMVYFVSPYQHLSYTKKEEVYWSSPVDIIFQPEQFPAWNGNQVSLAAAATNNHEHLYYVSLDRTLNEFALETNKSWPLQATLVPKSSEHDDIGGSIAAIAWQDSVRVFYWSGNTLVQAALGGGAWTKSSV